MFHRKLLFTLAFIAALLAARCFAWAEGTEPGVGRLIPVDLERGEQVFSLTPASNSAFDICVFPAEGFDGATARLYHGDDVIAEGEGSLTLISERLKAGETYTLRLTGAGRAWLEMARHALSRCFDDPKPLHAEGDAYAKAIVNPQDAHWYSITASGSQPVLLSGLPEETGLRLEAQLFSESGRLLAEATRTAGGAFLMDFMPRAGRQYRVRVSASEGGTGLYDLKVAPGEGGLPEAVLLSATA